MRKIKKQMVEVEELFCECCGKQYEENHKGEFALTARNQNSVCFEYWLGLDICAVCAIKFSNYIYTQLSKIGLSERYEEKDEEKIKRWLKRCVDLADKDAEEDDI